jgi:rhodanese-related sulfurtransferase
VQVKNISASDVAGLQKEGWVVLDCRPPTEQERAPVANAVHVSLPQTKHAMLQHKIRYPAAAAPFWQDKTDAQQRMRSGREALCACSDLCRGRCLSSSLIQAMTFHHS